MEEFADFEMIESSLNDSSKPILKTGNDNVPEKKQNKKDIIVGSIAENFENILSLAGDIVEIKKMQVQADAVLGQMREKRHLILDEAEAYARKKHADTKDVIERMNIIRSMMQDYYAASNNNISSEDFRAVITEIVNQLGRISNEQ